MSTDVKASKKRPSVRESMEVKRGTQGLGRMLRRGLHGAKNWVLEPDENGVHRTVGSKAFRAAAALAPGWIVASAFTGNPKSGGEQVGVFQAFFMAMLVTVCMLAFFSARERRMGREEPWSEEDIAAESEGSQDEASAAPEQGLSHIPGQGSPVDDENAERPTEILENPQVKEVTTEVTTPPSGDNGDEKDHFELSEPPLVTSVVSEAVTQTLPVGVQDEVFDQVSDRVTIPGKAVTPVVTSVVSQPEEKIEYPPIVDILEEESPTVRLGGGHLGEEAVTEIPEGPVNPQVSEGDQVVTLEPEGASRVSLEKASRTKSPDLEPSVVTQAVTQPVTKSTQEPLFPQVKKVEKPVTRPVTSVVTPPSMATVGPYGPTEDPLADDWWSVPPDAPEAEPTKVSEKVAEEAVEVEEETVEPRPEKETSTPRETAQEAPEEIVETPEVSINEVPNRTEVSNVGIPQEVMPFLATRHSREVSKEAKERARQAAITWLRRETKENGLTQRQAASILGVSKTTVLNWLSDDPWMVHEEDETE